MKDYTSRRVDRLTKRYYKACEEGRFDDAQTIAGAISNYDAKDKWITVHGTSTKVDENGTAISGPLKGMNFSGADSTVSKNKRHNDMKSLRADLCDFLRDYHDNGCIDDDTKFTVIYENGNSMCYPDDVADMKKNGIAYIYKINADDECDSDCGFYVAILGPEKKDDYFKYIENKYGHKNEELAKLYEKEKKPHYMTLSDFQSWEDTKKQHNDRGGKKR